MGCGLRHCHDQVGGGSQWGGCGRMARGYTHRGDEAQVLCAAGSLEDHTGNPVALSFLTSFSLRPTPLLWPGTCRKQAQYSPMSQAAWVCVCEVPVEISNCWRKTKSLSLSHLKANWEESGRNRGGWSEGRERCWLLGRAHVPAEGADGPWVTGRGWATGHAALSLRARNGSELP